MIIFGLPLLDLLWWRWADGRLRPLPRARRWRGLLAAFVLFQLACYVAMIGLRFAGFRHEMPAALITLTYIWHLLVLPLTMVLVSAGSAVALAGQAARALRRWMRQQECPAAPDADEPEAATLSRREMLGAAVTALPPLVTGAAVLRSVPQMDDFRVRALDVPIPGLPIDLDGATIAHVSDAHVGPFTRGRVLHAIAERTNALRADLVLMTGDLINSSLVDLPEALAMIARIDPRRGLFMCEGNHDLIDSREGFERGVKEAGVPLLLNEAAQVRVRGVPVQVMGLRWGRAGAGRDALIEPHLAELLPRRHGDAFPILLAHHPHAFDAAADAGITLTLAGHTHGGQLMVSRTLGIGPGPLMFKYWSGLYRRGGSALAVSNGVGNWFPLRLNAPAEILHLTLRQGERSGAAI